MQDEDRIISTNPREEDGDPEQRSLRPNSLGEYIGQEKLKRGSRRQMPACLHGYGSCHADRYA